ncbi:MAG: metallophosphoesterase [Armatimonadetes bacterium]|nr:metallophosphoesterase [Armatimonadota bacterium]
MWRESRDLDLFCCREDVPAVLAGLKAAGLGCSRLAEPIDRCQARVVFHGHAHRGKHRARTSRGVPVYNVALPVMRLTSPEQPYLIFEI